MRVAFCLFRYFPFGGLERDFFQVARYFAEQGHSVQVYTMHWKGKKPHFFSVHEIPVFALTNHNRAKKFVKKCRAILKSEAFDCVIGFNKMPGLDYYYAADVCYAHSRQEKRGSWTRFFPRDRVWMDLEQSVFSPTCSTRIFLLNEMQLRIYQDYYHTPPTRLLLLPPSLPIERYPTKALSQLRPLAREQFQIDAKQLVLLIIATCLTTKGFDRVLVACHTLPPALKHRVVVWVIGSEENAKYINQSAADGIAVKFWGRQENILPFLHAADLMVHPARVESAGWVLLEALVNGLPVLTTANCGFASYIVEAEAGEVCSDPFEQQEFNQKLQSLLCKDQARAWYSQHGYRYGKKTAWGELGPTLYNLIIMNQ